MADFEQSEQDVRDIERERDLPPDEPPEAVIWTPRFSQARQYLLDAAEYLTEDDLDPEEALRCAREATGRIEGLL